MLRQLLTLLAVISGFTLAAEPVAAADVRAVSVAAAQAGEDCQAIVAGPLQFGGRKARQRDADDARCDRPVVVIVTPAVQLQADRARE